MDKKLLLIPFLIIAYSILLFSKQSLFTIHIIAIILIFVLFFAHPKTRAVITHIFPIILYGMVYDSMRFFPNYEINPIHIKEPFDMELAFFGIFHEGSKITLNQFFEIYQNSTFDVLSGIVYLTWVPIPIVLAIFWYFKNAEFAKQFIWAFILTGILGAVGYYLYPAAPPWYVAKYGFNFVVEAKGSAAGLTRFDQMFDISIFEGIYGASSNIYGAIPSIHCANPVVVCFFLVKKYGKKLLPLGLFYIVWMWFGAVYSSHHYLIDAFAGLLTAFIGIMLSYLFVKK